MSGDAFNPYHDPVARELHDANAQLHAVRQELWDANQPLEVRASLQARRADHARAMRWGVRVVIGLGALWFALSLLFGRAGARLFGGLLSFLLDAVGVLIVVGCFAWIGSTLWRAGRWVAGRGDARP